MHEVNATRATIAKPLAGVSLLYRRKKHFSDLENAGGQK